jgi:cell volume regulation protein A
MELLTPIPVTVDQFMLVGGALALAAIVVSALVNQRFRLPGALLLLVIGMLVGDDGLGLISLNDPDLVRDVGVVALALILLDGGLTTKPADLRIAALPGLLLSTVGVVVTAGVTAIGVWLLLDVDPLTAALIGAVVGSTDAAAVLSMMRGSSLPRRSEALLRVEAGTNDPMAIMLTVGLIASVNDATSVVGWAWFLVVQLVGGTVVGGVVGVLGGLGLRRLRLTIDGFYPLAVAALGAVSYGLAATLGASGFIAVFVTGFAIGVLIPRYRRVILDFHEATANAAEIGLFLVLGLLVFPSRLPAVALAATVVALILTFVARPAAVWLCTLRQGFDWRERTVISVGGLKGAVPIVLATFPLTAGIQGADLIFNVVFFVTLVSLVVQGTGLVPTVRALGLENDRSAWAPVAESIPLYGIEIDIIELTVTDEMHIVGKPLSDLSMPPGSSVTALVRHNEVLIPNGDTTPRVDDVLLITTTDRTNDALQRCTAWARGAG